MLVICSQCDKRHEVMKPDKEVDILCSCGEALMVLPGGSNRQIISKQKQVQCPLCNRSFELQTFRENTEIVCSCRNLLVISNDNVSGMPIGRRKTDEAFQLLEKELLGLIDTSHLIHASIHNLDKLLVLIVRKTTEMLDVEACSVVMRDSVKDCLVFYAITGDKSSELSSFEIAENEGIVGSCVTKRSTIVANNVESDSRFSQRADEASGFVTRSLLCVPLLVEDECIGALEMVNKKDINGFDKRDILLAEGIASQIAVAIQNVQLTQKALKAERRAAIGEAVAGVAHCIKNMLNGLQGGFYVLKSDIKKASGDIPERGFEMLDRNLKRLIDLVYDMLYCSKERRPEYEPADINEVVGSVVELMQQKARERKLELRFTPDKGLGKMAIDTKGIYRCVLNLVSNALDACNGKKDAVVIVSTNTGNAGEVVIRISDKGCGMDEATVNSIFEPFFSKKGSDGTGLGLSVTRKIVEEHTGRIEVDSAINVGSTFSIYLPGQQKQMSYAHPLRKEE